MVTLRVLFYCVHVMLAPVPVVLHSFRRLWLRFILPQITHRHPVRERSCQPKLQVLSAEPLLTRGLSMIPLRSEPNLVTMQLWNHPLL
jgi:hypothetical protein